MAERIQDLKNRITQGGPREAVIRALLYIRIPEGVVDERGFNLLRQLREEAGKGLTLPAFKTLVREQYFMLLLDEHRAVEAIPDMLARDPELASRMAGNLRRLVDAVGVRTDVAKARLAEIETMFAGRRLREAITASAREDAHADGGSVRPHTARKSKHR
jgi:hypothetical protein